MYQLLRGMLDNEPVKRLSIDNVIICLTLIHECNSKAKLSENLAVITKMVDTALANTGIQQPQQVLQANKQPVANKHSSLQVGNSNKRARKELERK